MWPFYNGRLSRWFSHVQIEDDIYLDPILFDYLENPTTTFLQEY